MKVIDSAPAVLEALRNGPLNQGDLSEAVWGSSGRGNKTLTRSLFPFLVRKGWVTLVTKGRTKHFFLTEKGKSLIGDGDPYSKWDMETHQFKS